MPPSEPAERFDITLEVRPDDIDQLGHVNNVVYLRWVQDVAVAHWRARATPEQQATMFWDVVRHEIDYKRAARRGDTIIVRTWVGEAGARDFERFTDILRARDRKLLAHARTLWCPIDAQSGRPLAVGADVRERFSMSAPAAPRSEAGKKAD